MGCIVNRSMKTILAERFNISSSSRDSKRNETNYKRYTIITVLQCPAVSITIEKEALSLVYGIQRFLSYLYSRPFILYTDHKPLTDILGAHKSIASLGITTGWLQLSHCFQTNISSCQCK